MYSLLQGNIQNPAQQRVTIQSQFPRTDSMPHTAEKHRGKGRTYPLQSHKAGEKETTEAEAQDQKMTWFVTNSLQGHPLDSHHKIYTGPVLRTPEQDTVLQISADPSVVIDGHFRTSSLSFLPLHILFSLPPSSYEAVERLGEREDCNTHPLVLDDGQRGDAVGSQGTGYPGEEQGHPL
ncbi:hypothetical protein BTVI_88117 [Pitangus sulphuratus]|nr:hypothetical protein BTVI_88117 [Pitangus sulphuratus]